ncbi:3-mercaptopropionate dioxygenase [bacterium MnTg02]|nr:3-mercaptopropionate dioxygenase [bacterium MnTg02]
MPTLAEKRADAVSEALATVRNIEQAQGAGRDELDEMAVVLKDLAAQRNYWSEDAYPSPPEGELQSRYLIHEDPEQKLSLYLNVMRPGKCVPPHNHTTWACIAAVEGTEHNYLYERLDDGSTPGKADIRRTAHIPVEPGTSITLLPDDIHAVEIKGEKPIRHLHMYGRSLEALSERLTFDEEAGTCSVMDVGVKTQHAS